MVDSNKSRVVQKENNPEAYKKMKEKKAAYMRRRRAAQQGDENAIIAERVDQELRKARQPALEDAIRQHNTNLLDLLTNVRREAPSEEEVGEMMEKAEQALPVLLTEIKTNTTCDELIDLVLAGRIAQEQELAKTAIGKAEGPLVKYNAQSALDGEYNFQGSSKEVAGLRIERGDNVLLVRRAISRQSGTWTTFYCFCGSTGGRTNVSMKILRSRIATCRHLSWRKLRMAFFWRQASERRIATCTTGLRMPTKEVRRRYGDITAMTVIAPCGKSGALWWLL